MMFKSIKTKFLISQIGLVISVSALLGFVAYFIMVDSVKKSQREYLTHISRDQANHLNLFIEKKSGIIERLANNKAVTEYSREFNEIRLIEHFAKFAKEFPIIAYVNEEGSEELKLVHGRLTEELSDISETVIFEEATWEHNKVYALLSAHPSDFSKLYMEFGICNYSYFDEFEGLIVGRIPFTDLTKSIREFIVGQTGFISLIDNNGTILSHPQKDKILQKIPADDVQNAQILSDVKSMKCGFSRSTILGTDAYVAYSPVEGTNWVLMAALPYKEFMAAPNTLKNTALVISLILLVAGSALSLSLATKITSPILKLVDKTTMIANGELSQKVDIKSKDEIGILALSFNQMVENLKESTTSIANLNREIERRNKAEQSLKELNEKLIQSNQQLQEFTYVASHDLKEPVRKINSFGQLLADSLTNNLSGDDRENLNYMIDGAHRMQLMVEALLIYSRVSTKDVKSEQLDLNETVEQLKELELAVRLEESNGIILVPEPLPNVNGDATQIRQLLQNLILNALKYRKKDTLPEVTIRAHKEGNGMVRVEVKDNGIGIKKEEYDKVFVMFKRLHSRDEYEGTGIGLAVCKRIIERHRGEIGVESAYGQGSTFWFTLPASVSVQKQENELVLVSTNSEI